MKTPRFSLLNDFKKLDWNRQKRIFMIITGALFLVLLVVILSFCASGEKEPANTGNNEDPVLEEPAAEDIYYVTAHDNSNVNVRKEPSVDSDRVLRISAGDTSIKLKYTGESVYNEEFFWHHVVLPDGGSGWVREDVVAVDEINEESGD